MNTKPTPPEVTAYDTRSREFADAYESLGFEQVHKHILDLLPKATARILATTIKQRVDCAMPLD